MSVTAKALINTSAAPGSDTTKYTAPAATRTIIDKFTATNTDASARTLTLNIVPSGGSLGASTIVTKALSIAAGTTVEIAEMKNQVLNSGDQVFVSASVAAVVNVRMSGREVT